jgi:hypothetical protein
MAFNVMLVLELSVSDKIFNSLPFDSIQLESLQSSVHPEERVGYSQ